MRRPKARDIVDRRDQRAGSDRPDARRRRQQRDGGIGSRQLCDPVIRSRDLRVQRPEQRDERGQFARQRRREFELGEPRHYPLTLSAGDAESIPPNERLGERDVTGPSPHERLPDGELRPDVPAGVGQSVRPAEGAQSARLGERPRIAPVGLHPPRARGVHRREVRVGDDHGEPQRLEVARDPLTLGAGLEEHSRGRQWPKDGGEAVVAGEDPLFPRGPVRREDAKLRLAFVQIQAYRIHWRLASVVCDIDRV